MTHHKPPELPGETLQLPPAASEAPRHQFGRGRLMRWQVACEKYTTAFQQTILIWPFIKWRLFEVICVWSTVPPARFRDTLSRTFSDTWTSNCFFWGSMRWLLSCRFVCVANTHAGCGGLEQCPMRYARDVCPARAEVLIASCKTPEQSHDLTELPSDVRNQLVSARSETDEIKFSFWILNVRKWGRMLQKGFKNVKRT